MRGRRWTLLGAGLAATVLALVVGWQALAARAPAVAVFRRVAPAVVLVTRGTTVPGVGGRLDWGSGVLFDRRGDIVTNDHVVVGAQRLWVTLAGGRTLPAALVGADPATDLAVLRVAAGRPTPKARFAIRSTIATGQTAVAIGNPLGPRYALTLTQGVVSAVRPMLYGMGTHGQRVTEMIQTDTPLNPGSSGGPLLNSRGRVIGINSVKVVQAQPGLAVAGLAFAIPAPTVMAVAYALLAHGYVPRAWLGACLAPVPPSVLPGQAQALVVGGLLPQGPAARAGLRPGDALVAWDGVPLADQLALVRRLNAARPGMAVRLTVLRAGQPHPIDLTLGSGPEPALTC